MRGAFYLAALAVVLAGYGAKDELTLRALRDHDDRTRGLMVIALFTSTISAAVMAWAGLTLGASLSASARMMLIAFVLLLAGIEILRPVRQPDMREPTRSFGAITLVLLSRQITDGPRLLVFAVAAFTQAGWLAAIGGALGGAATALRALIGPSGEHSMRTERRLRIALGLAVILLGLVLGLRARGIL